MNAGRDRVARDGKWTGGPVPFGYDIVESRLAPSARQVPQLEITEAGAARDIFVRIANGSTAMMEARRLNLMGVPSIKRFAPGREKGKRDGVELVSRGGWSASRICDTIRSTVYRGVFSLKSRFGTVEYAVPAIVSADLWEQAGAQLLRNRLVASRNAHTLYLLRGLMRCGLCGQTFSGYLGNAHRDGSRQQRYRCTSYNQRARGTARCRARSIPAADIEGYVWGDCRAFLENPREALAEAQRQLRERMSQSTDLAAERARVSARLAAKDSERQRVIDLYRRNVITVDEAEQQLDQIGQEKSEVEAELGRIDARAALAEQMESHLAGAANLLARLHARRPDLDAGKDDAAKREIIECLVTRITIDEDEVQQVATITYAFGDGPPTGPIVSGTGTRILTARRKSRRSRVWGGCSGACRDAEYDR